MPVLSSYADVHTSTTESEEEQVYEFNKLFIYSPVFARLLDGSCSGSPDIRLDALSLTISGRRRASQTCGFSFHHTGKTSSEAFISLD
jgi:hypothetical protein